MDKTDDTKTLGLTMLDWVNFFSQAITFFLLLLWPTLKTFASINVKAKKGTHRGTMSLYWIGLGPVMMVFQITAALFSKFKLYPFIQVFLAFILSLSDGKIIRNIGHKFVYPFFYNHYAQMKQLPENFQVLIKKVIYFPFGGYHPDESLHHHSRHQNEGSPISE